MALPLYVRSGPNQELQKKAKCQRMSQKKFPAPKFIDNSQPVKLKPHVTEINLHVNFFTIFEFMIRINDNKI